MFMVSPSGLRPSLVEYLGSYRIYLRVLVGQYDRVQIILWYPSWVISSLLLSASPRQVFGVAAASHAASSWRHGPLVRETPQICLGEALQRRLVRLCSYTRKKAHKKERQGQEASGSQNWMAVWENHVFCYDPQKSQHDSTAAQFSTFRSMALQMVRYVAFE